MGADCLYAYDTGIIYITAGKMNGEIPVLLICSQIQKQVNIQLLLEKE